MKVPIQQAAKDLVRNAKIIKQYYRKGLFPTKN